ncbi:MAG: ATP-binding protein [Clostridia bacterium]|nr:ATP-binding protein [Clostridia bacterium]
MGELVEKHFPAKALLTGLRAIGYNFSTAVADIIDNSVSAQANTVRIYSDPLATIPYFCILDNGNGMSFAELNNAMLPGSDRTGKEDCELELGRFGLGLKSASLSQCREFIVASKKYGKINAMSFDLDEIENSNKLVLSVLDKNEIAELPYIAELREYYSGTLVVWEKFDKIESSSKSFEDSFRSAVAEAKKHVEFVFHRFYDDLEIYFNNKRIERRDPFLLGSFGRQQTGRTTRISIGESIITVTPYTLPFANTLTSEEKALLGNPKSIYDEQGFYIYRNKRLISWGNWMRMGIRSELNKLARIQVDIPSSLDEVWTLDVKKSSAKIPDIIKNQIKAAVEDSVIRSRRTTRFPGVKEQMPEVQVWDRVNLHEGQIKYQINREMPAIVALSNAIGESEKELLEIVLSQIESYLPKYRINNDNMDALTIVNSGEDVEDERLISEIETIIAFFDSETRKSVFENIFMAENYQRLLPRKEEIKRRIFGNDN